MNNNGILNVMAHLKNLIEGGRYMEGRQDLYIFFLFDFVGFLGQANLKHLRGLL